MTSYVRSQIRDRAVEVSEDGGCFQATVERQVCWELIEHARDMEDFVCRWAAAPLDLVIDVAMAELQGFR